MSQFYTNPAREEDDHALPDAEVFHMAASDFLHADDGTWMFEAMTAAAEDAAAEENHTDTTIDAAVVAAAHAAEGWYYWFCFPGCMPDSDPVGPFATEQEAIEDARNNG